MNLRALLVRLRALVSSSRVDAELDEELALHMAQEAERFRAAGMTAAEAEHAARRSVGNVPLLREQARDSFGWGWLERAWQDARCAVRSLFRAPAFVVTTVVTLGLGIGLSAAAFSLVNQLVLHPLPFAHEDRLVLLNMHDEKSGISTSPAPVTVELWQHTAHSLDAVSVLGNIRFFVSDANHALMANGADVSPALFSMLEVTPVRGRNLLAGDTVSGAPRVAMIGELLWRREFGARNDVIGHELRLDDTTYTIVGIAPARLNAIVIYRDVDVWTPIAPGRALARRGRRMYGMDVIARLRAGVPVAVAQRELQALDDRARRDAGAPSRTGELPTVRLSRPSDYLGEELRIGLWVVFGATGLVLLIACANVANLQLVRSLRRTGELAVRRALGASTLRLLRQFLVEGMVLTALGAAVGLVVARWAMQAVIALRPEQMRQLTVVRFDWSAVLFAILMSALASVLFAIVPVWKQGSASLADGLRASARSGTRRRRLQPVVVCAEIALSLVLLSGAGLLGRSLVALQHVDPGFVPEGVLEYSVLLRGAQFPDSVSRDAFWRAFLPRVQSLPGVQLASVPLSLPSEGGLSLYDSVQVEGRAMQPGEGHLTFADRDVSSRYLSVLQTRFVEGRTFTAADEHGETDAVIVGEQTARVLWPNEDPLGKRFRTGPQNAWHTVVGVLADQGAVSGRSAVVTALQLYYPEAETRLHPRRGLLVRAAPGVSTDQVAARLTQLLHGINRAIPVTAARSENDLLNAQRARPRFITTILSVFATLALFLAAFGLYGVISYSVGERVREIGIRMALGARAGDVTQLVLRNGLTLTIIGASIGMAGSMAASRLIRSLLYGVTPLDPWVLAVTPIVLVAVALFACAIPARRAARLDPLVALRHE